MESDVKRKLPIVTIIFIVLNVCIWIVLELMGDTLDSNFMITYGASYAPFIIENGEYWRLFTCMFLHFGADHLINNMLLLGVMGYRLEHVMGSICFGILYLASGLGGSILSFYKDLGAAEEVVSAGASGGVYGIIGGLIAYAILNKGKVEGMTIKGLIGMAVLSLYYGFSTAGVDNWGHIGGLLFGFLLGCILVTIHGLRTAHSNSSGRYL